MKNRQTKASSLIKSMFEEHEKSFTPAEILENMKDSVDRVTVYRVLQRLEEQQFVHKFIGLDGKIHYAKCLPDNCEASDHEHSHAHAHFSCTTCQEVTCLNDVIPHIHLPKNYQLQDTNIVLSGVCPSCH